MNFLNKLFHAGANILGTALRETLVDKLSSFFEKKLGGLFGGGDDGGSEGYGLRKFGRSSFDSRPEYRKAMELFGQIRHGADNMMSLLSGDRGIYDEE